MIRGQSDPVVVRRHISALRDALHNLQRHSSCTAAELRVNADLRWAVERGLQLSVQNVLDIATHISAASGMDAPNYTAAIDRMAELKVLPQEFATRIRTIAGFRNVLVHGYLQVDLNVVEKVLSQRLGDLAEFADRVERSFEDDEA